MFRGMGLRCGAALALALAGSFPAAAAGGCGSRDPAEVEACVREAAPRGYGAAERALVEAGFSRTATLEDGSVYFMRKGGFLAGPDLMVSVVRDGDTVDRVAVAK